MLHQNLRVLCGEKNCDRKISKNLHNSTNNCQTTPEQQQVIPCLAEAEPTQSLVKICPSMFKLPTCKVKNLLRRRSSALRSLNSQRNIPLTSHNHSMLSCPTTIQFGADFVQYLSRKSPWKMIVISQKIPRFACFFSFFYIPQLHQMTEILIQKHLHHVPLTQTFQSGWNCRTNGTTKWATRTNVAKWSVFCVMMAQNQGKSIHKPQFYITQHTKHINVLPEPQSLVGCGQIAQKQLTRRVNKLQKKKNKRLPNAPLRPYVDRRKFGILDLLTEDDTQNDVNVHFEPCNFSVFQPNHPKQAANSCPRYWQMLTAWFVVVLCVLI